MPGDLDWSPTDFNASGGVGSLRKHDAFVGNGAVTGFTFDEEPNAEPIEVFLNGALLTINLATGLSYVLSDTYVLERTSVIFKEDNVTMTPTAQDNMDLFYYTD